MRIMENADMREYTSFKAGGRATRLIIADDPSELLTALKDATDNDFVLIGNGSDTLFTDKGYPGTVIKLGEGFSDIKVDGTRITAGAAVLLSTVARVAQKETLTGMEKISGIPGSIGGAVYMNAGAYGGEIKDVLESVEVIFLGKDGAEHLSVLDLDLSYRHSVFMEKKAIITSATFSLDYGDRAEIDRKMREYTDRRNEKQPLEYPSAGSFFKRPDGHFAGKLIEDAGLKGLSHGGAQVSEKHSGFIINTGDATATDIIELMHLVQNTVNDKFGVMLEPEVRIIGEL